MPPKADPTEQRKNQPRQLILTDIEVRIVERLVRGEHASHGLGIGDLIGGEYSDFLEGLNDAQKLQLLVKLERLGVL